MKIFWLGLFDLAFCREKCHRLPMPSKPGLAFPKYGVLMEIVNQNIGHFSALFKPLLISVAKLQQYL